MQTKFRIVLTLILLLFFIFPMEEVEAAKIDKPSISISSKYNSSATIKWKKIKGVKGYKVYRSTDNKKFKRVADTTKTSYTDKDVKINKKYYYKVRAYKTVKGKTTHGKYSKVITIKPSSKIVVSQEKLLSGARTGIGTPYINRYYKGGYPPKGEGVCTDVIWQAFKKAGYNLKSNIDKDIKANKTAYLGRHGKPDPNIDFRMVNNLVKFFDKYANKKLTTKLIPKDKANLKQWKGGDIVVFKGHIAIVSDKKNKDGIPYLIHNQEQKERPAKWAEADDFLFRMKKAPIIRHYRCW